MVQYWWVNQTRNHKFERSVGIVAGQINKENRDLTHYGRKNVKKMNVDDLLVCYVRSMGIDYVARVVQKYQEKPAPWPGSDENETAYVASVKYFPIKPTILQEEFSDKIQKFGCYPKGPITRSGEIKEGYAFIFNKDGFDNLMNLRKLSQRDFEI
jgi:hypothetical protein